MLLVCLAGSPASAKDVRRLWFVGGTLGYHTTEDTVENNALILEDARPDDYVSRESGVEDTVSFGLHAGFGLTSRVVLQLDTGYFQGEVGSVDAYLQRQFPIASTLNQANLNILAQADSSLAFMAGDLTQIPVTLSGVVRFRKDRPWNPFVGIGAGMVFMGFENSEEFEEMSRRLRNLHIMGFEDELGRNITPPLLRQLGADGKVPLLYPVSVRVDDSFVWHLSAGIEYEIHQTMSFVADVRYAHVREPLVVDLNGPDQVNIQIYAEEVWRPDGSLRIFIDSSNPPNPFRPLPPGAPFPVRYNCVPGTVGDFDVDGHADDLCYDESQLMSGDEYTGVFTIQGGEIDLSGFVAQLGLRWYF